jgi:hypothetical protein
MLIQEFIQKHYRRDPGRAVPISTIVRAVRDAEPDIPGDAIRRYLETRFVTGSVDGERCVANLTGAGRIVVAERELVCEHGELLPRDLTEDEFAFVIPHTSSKRTLTKNQMGARGWGKVILSRAQQIRRARLEQN